MAIVLARRDRTNVRFALFDCPHAEAFVAAAPDVFAEEERAAKCGPLASLGAVFSAQAVL